MLTHVIKCVSEPVLCRSQEHTRANPLKRISITCFFIYKAMCVHALVCMHARTHVELRKKTYMCAYMQWPEVSLRCHSSGMIHFVFEFCFLFCFVLRQSLTSLELTNLARLASQGAQEITPVSACITPT